MTQKPDMAVIVNHLIDVLFKEAQIAGIYKTDFFSATEEEKGKYIEFIKQLYFVTALYTEKGLFAIEMGDFGLAAKLFGDAMRIDVPENDYWYQYFGCAAMLYGAKREEEAREVLSKLKQKNPLFKDQMKNIFNRTTVMMGDEVKAGLLKLIESIE